MKLNGNVGLALLLIIFGGLILLGKFASVAGYLMGYLVPVAMIAIGYWSFRSGNRLLGGFILFVGAVILLGKLSGMVSIILAVGLILYGLSLFRKKSAY